MKKTPNKLKGLNLGKLGLQTSPKPILMMGKIVFPAAAKNYLKKIKPTKKVIKKKVVSKPVAGPSNKELIQVEIDPIGDREW